MFRGHRTRSTARRRSFSGKYQALRGRSEMEKMRRGENKKMLSRRKFLIFCFLICNFLIVNQTAFANYSRFQNSQILFADKFLRTELYFGTDMPGGGKVT